ncbi:intein-containing DNA polymerase II large subunit [Halarchaeum grantii]|uniref:DNA polymerase II large subunit n=1 Tax=Halarchaeum grantii TaxID=1193105 RepID=A0A830F3E4_9EURY|nr:DNA polymerase II large subunit [Halarchaeum grantii]GGL35210.1 intein-containing DNA polymerase II large subunit [Halarchaeum grantii]
MRPEDDAYFEGLESRLDEAFAVAEEAKTRGEDPVPEVEIPVAKDMADRVENILGIEGVAERVRDLEGEMGREEAALALVEDFVEGTVGDYDTRAGKIEGAVRTAVALLTEGVVAAPIEGIDRVELLQNDDGTEFVNVYYAGPIRSAGGTAQALSVLVADYARSLLGIEEYGARADEVERYAEEVSLYDDETGLQYSPKDEETRFIAEHMPIMLDGEATGDEEVSGFRDLERVDTNSARGGMCLVLAEGIALKAPKIQRYTRQLDEVEWPWLQDLIDGTYYDGGDDAADADEDEGDDGEDEATPEEPDDAPDGPPRVDPDSKFLRDLIAGRPVFGHPSEAGGFRLRYGRARNHGFATAGVHPATMHVVDDFLATGTQIKTERPGKAGGVVPVDSIEGPTVKLANGDVRRIDDPEEALEVRNGVVEILDLGEYLVNYGEFVENNHPLAPAGWTVEWWEQALKADGADVQALRDSPYVDLADPDAEQALSWAADYDTPLHPQYTYCWHDLTLEDFLALADAVDGAAVQADTLRVPNTEGARDALERLLVEHSQSDATLTVADWRPLVRTMGFDDDLEREWAPDDLPEAAREWPNAMRAVEAVAPFAVRERAPTRIGNRMGRPEKSESRDLSPAVHTLFPIGDAGGSQRSFREAADYAPDMRAEQGLVDVQLGERACPDCGEHTYKPRCESCGAWTDPHYECEDCGIVAEPDESGRVECPRCERELDNVERQTVDVRDAYREALQAVGERESAYDILKGVKGLTSTEKVPEPIEKGVLRAKHGVTTFKDGTVRYDMTDLPVTSVRPAELDVTVEDFRELGYTADVNGDPLQHDDQLVELRVQDIVLPDGAAEHMLKTADFVDELLEDYYGLEPFYDVAERQDLVGELVFGMAPHTSAAVVGRVVGFTSAAVGYAHPYFHAAKRRNCDGDEDCVMLLMDGLLNFSKSYLPDKRGGQMDAPLVMSSRIDPTEIDDEAHNMDVVERYPLEFYEATREMADPEDVDITIAEESLGTDEEYTGFAHTHDTTDIALGPDLSAYKTLGSMMEKMDAQLELARKLRAVDETDVAERVIEGHFLPDLIGNLRAFSRQETRCLDCGEKYRRMPLSGDCRECGGRVNLTVHEGSVNKYMDTAIQVAEEYDCREYTKQRLEVLEASLESVFEDDHNKQSGIADFM